MKTVGRDRFLVSVGRENCFSRILRISALTPLLIAVRELLQFNYVAVSKLYQHTEFERSAVDRFGGQGH